MCSAVVGPDDDDVRVRGPGGVRAPDLQPRLPRRPHHPVVALQRVHRLQHRRDPPHRRVDLHSQQSSQSHSGKHEQTAWLVSSLACLGVRQELGGQVGVELDLDRCRGVEPQPGVEQAVVQQLLEQQVRVGGGAGHQVL